MKTYKVTLTADIQVSDVRADNKRDAEARVEKVLTVAALKKIKLTVLKINAEEVQ